MVTFFAEPPEDPNSWREQLSAALPSLNREETVRSRSHLAAIRSLTLSQGTVAHGMYSTSAGALPTLVSVEEGWGRHSAFDLPQLRGPRPDSRRHRHEHREERLPLDDQALSALAAQLMPRSL